VTAVLDLYLTHAKNGVRFSQLERQRLARMRYAYTETTTDEEVTAA
jgi:non-homologous end joining protein Ku